VLPARGSAAGLHLRALPGAAADPNA